MERKFNNGGAFLWGAAWVSSRFQVKGVRWRLTYAPLNCSSLLSCYSHTRTGWNINCAQ